MSRTIFRIVGVLALATLSACPASASQIMESPKEIPLAFDADVVVVGGSSSAVEAACAAAARGASVVLLAERPYLGTDLCAMLRLWLEPGEQPKSKLPLACFGQGCSTTLLRVKAEMALALFQASVPYLTGCYVTDVLRDNDGRLAGRHRHGQSQRPAGGPGQGDCRCDLDSVLGWLPHIWMGVSVENEDHTFRIDHLHHATCLKLVEFRSSSSNGAASKKSGSAGTWRGGRGMKCRGLIPRATGIRLVIANR